MRRHFIVRDKLERHYLRLIALSLIVPTLITTGCLYYVIFTLMAEQLGIPEIVAYHLLPVLKKVNTVLAISIPVVFLILFSIGLVLTRNLAGPIRRLDGELKEIIAGNFQKRLRIRRKDELKPLVDDINMLIDRMTKAC